MPSVRRKLTTIFCADVEGYSRLMRADEETTLHTLKRSRDCMERLIELHSGRVINTWGDELIAEFSSVVEAVRAAVDIQNESSSHNLSLPDKACMRFRIGINLGDVIVDGDNIYGDGVNVAARLQSLASPGGIVISNTVYDQVRNKLSIGFEFMGQVEVKNIDGGVASYAVRTDSSVANRVTRNDNRAIDSNLKFISTQRVSSGHAICLLALFLEVLISISWPQLYWTRWPLLLLISLLLLKWMKTRKQGDYFMSMVFFIAGLLIAINLLSWNGDFWASWPLFGLAITAGIRWAVPNNGRSKH
ncbi:Adenylate cyclase, class 3 [Rhizobium mongolense subsp. loessense]|uniref:Adenylate cyclase, class 3 n=1 Tax=Rhizobium mongolense subsp. loessense TaxID=158890 RepID=A0A1G4U5F5_9HYPH|nr:Adenylate cyclase, class 3 [Rhizobium mongolense subsp. loessense]